MELEHCCLLTNAPFFCFVKICRIGRTRALVTQQDDVQWSSFVYWVVVGIIYAEERQITAANASEMPEIHLFGADSVDMFQNAIRAVGNYATIYMRNVQIVIPRAGLNLLYDEQGAGPLLWTYPFG